MSDLFRFNYEISGRYDKPKILFLHGFMGSLADWELQVRELSPHFQCIVLDLPGHGGTVVRDRNGYDFVTCAEGIVNFLLEKQLNPVNIVGYSLGGRIALHIALFKPDHVDRLILESASPGIASHKDRLLRVKQDTRLAHQLKSEWPGFVENWYRQTIFNGIMENPGYAQMIERKKLNDPEKLAYVLQGMGQGTQPSLWKNLRNLNIPVLLITGERDSKYMLISEKMQMKIPDCKSYVIPVCSHNIHLQNPDRFNQEVLKYLSNA